MLCLNGDTFILNGMASVCVFGIRHHRSPASMSKIKEENV